jgi:hypothetical protein
VSRWPRPASERHGLSRWPRFTAPMPATKSWVSRYRGGPGSQPRPGVEGVEVDGHSAASERPGVEVNATAPRTQPRRCPPRAFEVSRLRPGSQPRPRHSPRPAIMPAPVTCLSRWPGSQPRPERHGLSRWPRSLGCRGERPRPQPAPVHSAAPERHGLSRWPRFTAPRPRPAPVSRVSRLRPR